MGQSGLPSEPALQLFSCAWAKVRFSCHVWRWLTFGAVQVIALGLFAHPSSYLRSPWNQLDAVVVITSLVSSGAPNSHISILRALRLLRVLRPLRMISRFRVGLHEKLLWDVPANSSNCSVCLAFLAISCFVNPLPECWSCAVWHRQLVCLLTTSPEPQLMYCLLTLGAVMHAQHDLLPRLRSMEQCQQLSTAVQLNDTSKLQCVVTQATN